MKCQGILFRQVCMNPELSFSVADEVMNVCKNLKIH